MTGRLTIPLTLALFVGACGSTNSPSDDAGPSEDGGSAMDASGPAMDASGPAMDAGNGICCPVSLAAGCTGGTNEPAGGWAASAEACTLTLSGPFEEQVEAHGCTLLVRRTNFSACSPSDAGP